LLNLNYRWLVPDVTRSSIEYSMPRSCPSCWMSWLESSAQAPNRLGLARRTMEQANGNDGTIVGDDRIVRWSKFHTVAFSMMVLNGSLILTHRWFVARACRVQRPIEACSKEFAGSACARRPTARWWLVGLGHTVYNIEKKLGHV